MADAKKCDRCGVFFTLDDNDSEPTLIVKEYIDVNRHFATRGWITKDLCSSCCKALEHFMNMEPIGIEFVFHDNGFTLSNRYEVECGGKYCHEINKE